MFFEKSNTQQKANSTPRASRAVPHPSTDRAFRRLTSEFGWDRVYSTKYGRWRNRRSNNKHVLKLEVELPPLIIVKKTPQTNKPKSTHRHFFLPNFYFQGIRHILVGNENVVVMENALSRQSLVGPSDTHSNSNQSQSNHPNSKNQKNSSKNATPTARNNTLRSAASARTNLP